MVPKLLETIDRQRFELTVIFLEATEATLLRRYSETRRSHPLGQGERPVLDRRASCKPHKPVRAG